jgi:hypothetical protein
MKRNLLLAAGTSAAALAVAGTAVGAERTTNAPAIFTVKVTITEKGITMTPNHAVRGSTVTFIMTNRGKKTHTFFIGDTKRGAGFGQGFKQALKPNQQFTKVMFLDYRGTMKIFLRTGTVTTAHGAFKIT